MDITEQFSVMEVLKGSLNFIRENPVVLLHQSIIVILLYIPSLISGYIEPDKITPGAVNTSFIINSLFLFAAYGLLLLFFTIVIDAMYPLMIKNMKDRKELDTWSAFNVSKKKFFSILGALILVGLTVLFGFVLLVIPGLIFLAWYYYTIPAIMVNDVGAGEGMAASKDFAKDKKFKTFILYLSPYFFVYLLEDIFRNADITSGMSWLTDFGFELFLAVWIAVIPAYAYVRYAGVKEKQPTFH